MANKKINDLAAAGAVGATMQFETDIGGTIANKVTGAEIKTFAEADSVLKDGTAALTADWDAGSHKITAETLESDVVTGTAPLVIASTTAVSNLNADQVDGFDLNQAVTNGAAPDFATQAPGDNTTKVATTAFVDAHASLVQWGNTRTSTIGVGLTHTIGASAPAGVQSMVTTLNNTQANVLVPHQINLGTSDYGHTGLYITANTINDDLREIFLSLGAGKGTALEIGGTGDFRGINIVSGSTSSGHEGIFYTSSTVNCNALIFGADVTTVGNSRPRLMEANFEAQSASVNRLIDLVHIECRRNIAAVSATVNDNYNMIHFKRDTTRTSGVAITADGAVLNLENEVNGTLTDRVAVLKITQSANSIGIPLPIEQNHLTSTHFRKLTEETNTGIALWVSNGNTPNGALTGTAGDVCFNGSSNEIFHCNGGTAWSSTIDSPTLVKNSSNTTSPDFYSGLQINSDGQTAFTLSITPVNYRVYLNGILQPAGLAYTVVGNVFTWLDLNGLTLTKPPAANQPDELIVIMNDVASSQPPTTKYITVAEPNVNLGNGRYRQIGSTGSYRFSFQVPGDFVSWGVNGCQLQGVISANAATSGRDIDIAGEYAAAIGEAYNNTGFSDTATVRDYTGMANQNANAIDLTSFLSGVVAGDKVNVFVDHNGVGVGGIYYSNFALNYNR